MRLLTVYVFKAQHIMLFTQHIFWIRFVSSSAARVLVVLLSESSRAACLFAEIIMATVHDGAEETDS